MKRLLLLAALSGCHQYGPELSEQGNVVETCFVPAGHGSTSGFDSNGNAHFGSIDVPARYAVVFACEHGQFAITNKETWESVQKGDRVTIYYREVFTGDIVVDLDFLRAERIR